MNVVHIDRQLAWCGLQEELRSGTQGSRCGTSRSSTLCCRRTAGTSSGGGCRWLPLRPCGGCRGCYCSVWTPATPNSASCRDIDSIKLHSRSISRAQQRVDQSHGQMRGFLHAAAMAPDANAAFKPIATATTTGSAAVLFVQMSSQCAVGCGRERMPDALSFRDCLAATASRTQA